jgi:type IV secretory pathway TrbD component
VSALEIRSGGVIEVDTASLRAVAARLRAVGDGCGDLVRRLDDVAVRLADAGGEAAPVSWELSILRAGVARARDDAASIAAAVEETAVHYEMVELLVARGAAARSDDRAALERLDARIDALSEASPLARVRAERSVLSGADRTDLFQQGARGASVLGPGALALFAAAFGLVPGVIDIARRGVVPAGARLRGVAAPVVIRPLGTAAPAPVASLADAASRIPGDGDARVRVERYAMPGGSRQFVVYIAGTQAVGGREPWDMTSNLQLYGGERSASYAATLQALERAGARPGDVVHAVGHSQGAMIGERLALEGPYDARTVVSFGSPVQADVGDATLSVSVRHTDDPVVALSSGGSPAGVGAEGSIVVERSADPEVGVHDLSIPAHHMSAYAETAALVDASRDPRVDGVRQLFDALGAAETVTASEYAARRAGGEPAAPVVVSPSGAGAG